MADVGDKWKNPIVDTRGGQGLNSVSFSLANRMSRGLWRIAWFLLASWTPPPLHLWRRLLLRLFGARMGKGSRVYGSARIWYPPNLEMGENAVIGWGVECYCQGKITIGDFTVVSQFAHLVSGTHEIDAPGFQLQTRPINIGRHVWIAAGAFVGPGVTVGDGAVLGACGVAFRDMQAWGVYVGNPARYIRDRTRFIING